MMKVTEFFAEVKAELEADGYTLFNASERDDPDDPDFPFGFGVYEWLLLIEPTNKRIVINDSLPKTAQREAIFRALAYVTDRRVMARLDRLHGTIRRHVQSMRERLPKALDAELQLVEEYLRPGGPRPVEEIMAEAEAREKAEKRGRKGNRRGAAGGE